MHVYMQAWTGVSAHIQYMEYKKECRCTDRSAMCNVVQTRMSSLQCRIDISSSILNKEYNHTLLSLYSACMYHITISSMSLTLIASLFVM